MSVRKPLRLVALISGLALAGCAPVTFAPGTGIGISTGPGLNLNLSSCSPLAQSTLAARMGIHSAAVQMGAVRNRIAAIQSRYTAGSSYVRRQMSSWKGIASGECQ